MYQTFRLGSSHNKSLRTIVFFFFFSIFLRFLSRHAIVAFRPCTRPVPRRVLLGLFDPRTPCPLVSLEASLPRSCPFVTLSSGLLSLLVS